MMQEVRIESGMEVQTITVLRQLPRNSRIMSAVRAAAMRAFLDHAVDGGAHEEALIEQRRDGEAGRHAGQDLRAALLLTR